VIQEPRAGTVVWLDGTFVPWPEARMHVSDHHYGIGVFEGLRSYAAGDETSIFRLRDHTTRLLRSAHIMGIPIPVEYDVDYLDDVQTQVVRRNHLRDAYVRPFVFYGGLIGLSPRTQDLSVHVAVLALDWQPSGPRQGRDIGARGMVLRTATFMRHHPNSLFSKAKANGNYVNGILARQEVQASGADDALLLDQNGFATETSGANIFVVRGGCIHTPPAASALEGVTRDTIISLARAFGYAVTERPITRDEIYIADEVFVTGTAVEVTPVRELDGRRIGAGARGPLTEKLQLLYADHVRGQGEHRKEWLSRV
jgi:branched-chain amino acid aminotransferase